MAAAQPGTQRHWGGGAVSVRVGPAAVLSSPGLLVCRTRNEGVLVLVRFTSEHIHSLTPYLFYLLGYYMETHKEFFFFKKDFICREGKGGRERGRETSMQERRIDRLCLIRTPAVGTEPAAQAFAPTRN